MSTLENYQFEIEGIIFGFGAPLATNAEGFDAGTDEITSQDVERFGSDSVAFGEDTARPGSWTWELTSIDAEDAEQALYDASELGKVWRGASYRRTPSKVTPLRYKVAERTRIVFGRARRWAQTINNGILSGVIEIVCDFQRADTLFYDDQLQSTQITIIPAEPIGLQTPLITPITTLAGSPRQGTIAVVGGDVPAPFHVTVTGPVLNPKIYTDQWELQLVTSIPDGQSVTISTYPWEYRAIRSDGANLSGLLSAKSRLSKARLDPAGETLYFDGTDGTGAATCTLSWRSAYTSM